MPLNTLKHLKKYGNTIIPVKPSAGSTSSSAARIHTQASATLVPLSQQASASQGHFLAKGVRFWSLLRLQQHGNTAIIRAHDFMPSLLKRLKLAWAEKKGMKTKSNTNFAVRSARLADVLPYSFQSDAIAITSVGLAAQSGVPAGALDTAFSQLMRDPFWLFMCLDQRPSCQLNLRPLKHDSSALLDFVTVDQSSASITEAQEYEEQSTTGLSEDDALMAFFGAGSGPEHVSYMGASCRGLPQERLDSMQIDDALMQLAMCE